MKNAFRLGTVQNILDMYALATSEEKTFGETWYQEAHDIAQALANKYGYTLEQVIGVIAAISPMNRWAKNIVDAENILIANNAGLGFSAVKVSSFDKNKTKAFACISAKNMYDIDELMNAKKTTAFARNIYEPCKDEFVTVDGHAYCVSIGERIPLEQCPGMTAKRYDSVANLYRMAASELGLKGHVVQAITWVAYRRLNKITK